jgi:hypothetical protein
VMRGHASEPSNLFSYTDDTARARTHDPRGSGGTERQSLRVLMLCGVGHS